MPKTKQPLFDPLSKVPLKPGNPVPFYPIDNEWLLLKHRENLQDFIDLNPEEKEYLQEWDNFILKKHLSSDEYLPRAFTEFVKLKAGWIVEKQARAEEFAKHVSLLLARRVLGDQEVGEATRCLNSARARGKARDTGGYSAGRENGEEKRKKRGAGCCVKCGEVVGVVGMVVCGNKVSFMFLCLWLLGQLGSDGDWDANSKNRNAKTGCTTIPAFGSTVEGTVAARVGGVRLALPLELDWNNRHSRRAGMPALSIMVPGLVAGGPA